MEERACQCFCVLTLIPLMDLCLSDCAVEISCRCQISACSSSSQPLCHLITLPRALACPSFPFKLQHNCPSSWWHLIICSTFLLSSASSWPGRTTASSGCSTGRRAEVWPWRPGGKAASLGPCCGPGEFTPAASGGAETLAWIVWTLPKRSCTWPGTHQRISSP